MTDNKRFLVDVGMKDLPFPMRVASRRDPEGQATVAGISISARIMQEFEARWIDRFINVLHQHRERIGTDFLRTNIHDYRDELKASAIRIDFCYPYFVEKIAPFSGEPCLVQHPCTYSARMTTVDETPKIRFGIEIPCITTYPGSATAESGGLFGQLSSVAIEVESGEELYPEDLVELVDRNALAPVYSFLRTADQEFIIRKIHTDQVSSVVMTDAIREELARDSRVDWYSVNTTNSGMLHTYSTIVGTEKSQWVPYS